MAEEDTISVSNGVFVFKNNYKKSKRYSKKSVSKSQDDLFSQNLWYQEYNALWTSLNDEFEDLTSDMFASMTYDLLNFVRTSHQNILTEIPTAALLTGINMPDHDAQFKSLEKQVRTKITPHIACLKSQECSSLKFLIDNMLKQFFNDDDEQRYDEEDDVDQQKSQLKKSHLSLPLLQSWYEHLYPVKNDGKLLVVIIPDFEGFNMKILQNFILIVSSYLERLPFVFVFGIATSISTVHTSFSYHVTSKTNIRVFKCEPSTVHLNKMLEGVFLSPFCPFQLGGRVFDLFTEIFLYYDFSVRNFVQNIKYAMMEHFCHGNAMALCQMDKQRVRDILEEFKTEDCENIRQFMSFRKWVESEKYENQIELLLNDDYLKQAVYKQIVAIQRYIKRLHIFLKCLHTLVTDLPGAPLGKNLREVYALAVAKNITKSSEYKNAFQLLSFQSKDELSLKLKKISEIMEEFINEGSKKTQMKDCYSEIKRYSDALNNIDILSPESEEVEHEEMEAEDGADALSGVMDRTALKKALLSRSIQKPKPLNRYEKIRKEILDCVSRHFETYLIDPSSMPLYEIFFFDDMSIKSKIIGIHRSAIHNALNDPHYYLQCKCCEVTNTQHITPTMPDICIAYKLHLECGKMINLYDWLQAFLCIVNPDDESDLDDKSKQIVDPELQARFTQAVAELEYLGFVKSSKRKADHVTRLTWGG